MQRVSRCVGQQALAQPSVPDATRERVRFLFERAVAVFHGEPPPASPHTPEHSEFAKMAWQCEVRAYYVYAYGGGVGNVDPLQYAQRVASQLANIYFTARSKPGRDQAVLAAAAGAAQEAASVAPPVALAGTAVTRPDLWTIDDVDE